MKTLLTFSTLALVAALQAAPANALTTDQLNQVAAVETRIRDAIAQGQDTSGLVAELRSLHQQFGEDFGAFVGDDNPSDHDIVESALGRDDDGPGDDNGGESGDDGEDGGEGSDSGSGGEGGEDGGSGGEGGDDNGGDDNGGDDNGGGEGGNSGSGSSGSGGGGEGGEGGEGGDD